ncbi:MAG: anaerobic ribonucleoside-triphosphate reductase activating protein [Lachnospiraceae bacterium]|nr:anaerobic ribonucleoside-triphosphate reductase activating protein [Lachnospiraceae bacterium]
MLDLAGIVSDSIVDGPGIRTTIFCQGCPHHCPGCQNPETWPFGAGTPMEPEAVAEIIRQNPLVRGVTFSGGEPFAQAAEFARLGRMLKADGYEIAAYTGFLFEELFEGTAEQRELLETINVLIDGPFLLKERSLELNFRGSRNQRILDVPESLEKGAAVPQKNLRWLGEYE